MLHCGFVFLSQAFDGMGYSKAKGIGCAILRLFSEAAILACGSLGIILAECAALLQKSLFASEGVWNKYQLCILSQFN